MAWTKGGDLVPSASQIGRPEVSHQSARLLLTRGPAWRVVTAFETLVLVLPTQGALSGQDVREAGTAHVAGILAKFAAPCTLERIDACSYLCEPRLSGRT